MGQELNGKKRGQEKAQKSEPASRPSSAILGNTKVEAVIHTVRAWCTPMQALCMRAQPL